MSYLDRAQQYINENDSTESSRINDLVANSAKDPKNLKKIKYSLEKVLALPATIIPQIVPEKINNQAKLDLFILSEFIKASKIIQDKKSALKEVKHENKYNDLFVAIMKSRIALWGWSILDQPRRGNSEKGKDAGSLDIVIESGSDTIALAEAFIHKDKKYAQDHVLKCFTYDANLQCFYIIIYNKNKDFNNAWESHQKFVKDAKFDEKVSLLDKEINNGFVDLSGEFESILNIKVAKTQHNNSVVMYHIMINLNDN